MQNIFGILEASPIILQRFNLLAQKSYLNSPKATVQSNIGICSLQGTSVEDEYNDNDIMMEEFTLLEPQSHNDVDEVVILLKDLFIQR